MSSKTNEKEQVSFTKLYRNRFEKRIVDHLAEVAGIAENLHTKDALNAQLALVGRSIEGIAMMLNEQGYIDNRGRFVSFTPADILTINQALKVALALRNDILYIPNGAEGLAKTMQAASKTVDAVGASTNPNIGLSEPPPLRAVDSEPDTVQFESPIDDADEIVQPVHLPAITKKM